MVVELFRVEVEMILTRLCLGGSTRDLARPAHGHCSLGGIIGFPWNLNTSPQRPTLVELKGLVILSDRIILMQGELVVFA